MVGDGLNDPNVPGACVASHIHHVLARNPSVVRAISYADPGLGRQSPGFSAYEEDGGRMVIRQR
jgi:hypothetical protein